MARSFSVTSFVAGAILGALLLTAWFYSSPVSSDGSGTPTAQATATSSIPAGTPSGVVAISNQSAGATVTVDSVTVPPPGVWVAVREVLNGNQLGNVLGAARVGGPRTNITVPLLRATIPGETYAVELYRDNGDNAFDLSTDSVYVDFDTGSRVVAYFQTTD